MRRALLLTTSIALAGLLGAACGGDDESAAPGIEPRTTEPPPDPDDAGTGADDPADDPDDDPATTVPVPTTAGDLGSDLAWEPCDLGFDCATLEVPLDWDDPGGETIDLAVTRRPADDPDARVGALLMNPGGPGAGGVSFTQSISTLLDGEILDVFDVVGWDPRGVEASTPVECGFDPDRLYHPDPSPDDAAELEAIRTAQQEFAAACEEGAGVALLANVSTQDTARDLDAIRVALGDDQITYVGFSYGTSIGQTYANLFPANVRAMVLDGVVDLTMPAIDLAEAQYRAFERQLDALLERCASDPSCPFGDGDPGAAYDALQAQVETTPIPSDDPDRPVGPGEFQVGVFGNLYYSDAYQLLTSTLADAAAGDGQALLDGYLDYVNTSDPGAYAAINCVDAEWPTTDGFDALYAELSAEAPRIAASSAYEYEWCAYWPVPPVAPLPSLTAEGTPPILVVSTTGDPATPYEAGVHIAEVLSSGVLLTHEGDGHTAYLGDRCVTDAVDAYLLDLEVPRDGTVC